MGLFQSILESDTFQIWLTKLNEFAADSLSGIVDFNSLRVTNHKKEIPLCLFDTVDPPENIIIGGKSCISFASDVDNSIWFEFSFDSFKDYTQDDLNINLSFAMETAFAGDVVLVAEYYIYSLDMILTNPATPTGSVSQTITPENAELKFEQNSSLIIPKEDLSGSTDKILVKLTRDGDNVADTHTGKFYLFDVEIF